MRRRLAAIVGRFQRQFGDAFAHFDGEIAEVQFGPLHLLGEDSREDRIVGGVVAAQPVQCGLADAGRIQREDAARRPGVGQSTRVADGSAGGARKWIVATGVDHEQRHAHRPCLQFRNQIGLGERGAANACLCALGDGRHVAWDQVVDATDRYAMPGEEQRRRIAGLQARGEFGQFVDHRLTAEIGTDDDLEAECAQRVRDRGGVVGRFPELAVSGQVWIEVVADRKRDALLGHCRRCREGDACETQDAGHHRPPPDPDELNEMPHVVHGLMHHAPIRPS